MKVAIHARLKNGALWEAIERAGSQAELGRIIGLSAQDVGRWANFKWVPRSLDTPQMREIEAKLVQFAGITLDEVFPLELRQARNSRGEVPIRSKATVIAEVPVSQLLTGEVTRLLDTGFEEATLDRIDAERLKEQIENALRSLAPREAEILKARMGIDCEPQTLEQLAAVHDLSHERIRQIEAKALRKMRRSSRGLKSLVSSEWDVPLEKATTDTHLLRKVRMPEGSGLLMELLADGWRVSERNVRLGRERGETETRDAV